MLQLNPEMWVMTPKGEGLAFLVTDYGMDHNKIFTVMLQSGDILKNIRELRADNRKKGSARGAGGTPRSQKQILAIA
ncbi:MAG: hypothetical protein EBR82_83725, partial [Caulobacteraceae bacterium]|nr:hypothetical protein [Caulobacteraceae bacterium]